MKLSRWGLLRWAPAAAKDGKRRRLDSSSGGGDDGGSSSSSSDSGGGGDGHGAGHEGDESPEAGRPRLSPYGEPSYRPGGDPYGTGGVWLLVGLGALGRPVAGGGWGWWLLFWSVLERLRLKFCSCGWPTVLRVRARATPA